MRKILKGLTIFGILILFAALTPDCVKAADYNVTADGVWKIGTVSSGHTDVYIEGKRLCHNESGKAF